MMKTLFDLLLDSFIAKIVKTGLDRPTVRKQCAPVTRKCTNVKTFHVCHKWDNDNEL